jgi:hypothetical protein
VSGNITKDLIKKPLGRYYDDEVSKVPTTDYLTPPTPAALVKSIKGKRNLLFHVPTPNTSIWLENPAGLHLGWLRAFLTSGAIVHGSSYVDTPIRRLLALRTDQKIVINLQGSVPTGVYVFGAIRSYWSQKEDFKAVEINYTPGTLADFGFRPCEGARQRAYPLP